MLTFPTSLTHPQLLIDTYNLSLLILDATHGRTATWKGWSAVVQNPFPLSKRSLPIESQIRRRSPRLLAYVSAPLIPSHPPSPRSTGPFTPSCSQMPCQTVASRLPAEARATVPKAAAGGARWPSCLVLFTPSLKMQIQIQRLPQAPTRRMLEQESTPGSRTAPHRQPAAGYRPRSAAQRSALDNWHLGTSQGSTPSWHCGALLYRRRMGERGIRGTSRGGERCLFFPSPVSLPSRLQIWWWVKVMKFKPGFGRTLLKGY